MITTGVGVKVLRRIGFILLLLFPSSTISFAEETGSSFKLADIADQFPSKGFEVEIDFWKRMFTGYSDTQVVFHDRGDLRVIYEVVEFTRGIRADKKEAERQSKILKKKRDHFRELLLDLSRRRPRSQEENRIVTRLEELGHKPTASHYRRLASDLRYQRGLRQQFTEGIARSGRYLEAIQEILREERVPRELALLPHVESAFQWSAVSKAGAVGLWQFMRETARSYMTVNRYVDQRFDPLESTRAAARLLRDNYESLGTWPLAITAYNYGRSGMMRAKRRHGSEMLTIARHYKSRRFGFASRNFYPEFLAAVEVVRNQFLYFSDIQPSAGLEYEILVLPESYQVTVFEQVDGLDRATLKEYNPFLTSRVWKEGVLPAGVGLRLPLTALEAVRDALSKARPVTSSFELASDGVMIYRVRRGDTVGEIAARFGSSIGSIQRSNGLGDANLIVPGQRLRIPGAGASTRSRRYRVRSGDTLAEIANRFQTSLRELIQANALSNPNRIFLGQVILIP